MILLTRKDIETMVRNTVKTALESLKPEQKQELLQDLIELLEDIQGETE